jgi:hypothetical protein
VSTAVDVFPAASLMYDLGAMKPDDPKHLERAGDYVVKLNENFKNEYLYIGAVQWSKMIDLGLEHIIPNMLPHYGPGASEMRGHDLYYRQKITRHRYIAFKRPPGAYEVTEEEANAAFGIGLQFKKPFAMAMYVALLSMCGRFAKDKIFMKYALKMQGGKCTYKKVGCLRI